MKIKPLDKTDRNLPPLSLELCGNFAAGKWWNLTVSSLAVVLLTCSFTASERLLLIYWSNSQSRVEKIEVNTFCIHSKMWLLQGGVWAVKACIFVVFLNGSGSVEFQEQVWHYIAAGKRSPVHLFSIPLLVCFSCSPSAGVSGVVVGWIHTPNPPAISPIWKLNPWSCVCASNGERQTRPSGSDRDQNQLSCS